MASAVDSSGGEPARAASAASAALRESFRFETGLLAPVVGVVTALPVVAVFAIGLAAFSARDAVSMAVGANLVAFASLVRAPRLSLPLALVDAVAMALAVILGVSTTSITWLHAFLLVPLGFVAGFVTVFGLTQGVIGTQAIIAYVVLGRFSGSFPTALHLGLLVFIGALVEVVALVVLRLPPSLRFQRLQLASGLEAVAELARSSPRRSATEILAAVDNAGRSLASPSLLGRSDSRTLISVLNQLRRARLELTTMSGLRVRIAGRDRGLDDAIDRCARAAGTALDELALALRHRAPGAWRAAATSYHEALSALEGRLPDGDTELAVLAGQCATHLHAIDGQLRSMGGLIEELGADDSRHAWRTRIPSLAPFSSQERTDLSLARSNLTLTSPSLRHGVRLAVAVPAATLLAAWWNLPRGYWVAFAVAVILKPDYSTMLRRGVARVLGTAAGATIAALLVTVLHPGAVLTSVLVAALAWATYTTWSASFAGAVGLVTALVLVLLSVAQSNPISTAVDRLVDVAVGGALAVVVYVVWPTSPRAGVSEAFASLFAVLARYLGVVAPSISGDPVDAAILAEWSRVARIAWAHAEEAVGRGVEEPSSTRIDPVEGRGLLAVAMRVLRAIHALRIEAERGAVTAPCAELTDVLARCGEALTVLTEHFDDAAPARWEGLRPAYLAAEARLRDAGAPASIALHLDELVNALNTAEHLINVSPSRR